MKSKLKLKDYNNFNKKTTGMKDENDKKKLMKKLIGNKTLGSLYDNGEDVPKLDFMGKGSNSKSISQDVLKGNDEINGSKLRKLEEKNRKIWGMLNKEV